MAHKPPDSQRRKISTAFKKGPNLPGMDADASHAGIYLKVDGEAPSKLLCGLGQRLCHLKGADHWLTPIRGQRFAVVRECRGEHNKGSVYTCLDQGNGFVDVSHTKCGVASAYQVRGDDDRVMPVSIGLEHRPQRDCSHLRLQKTQIVREMVKMDKRLRLMPCT